MTSGHFQHVPIDQIWIDRENRQRREITGVEELAASIARVGLIHPPVIERNFRLRAGERRLTAIRSLGWTSIPIQWTDEVDESELQKIELEENLRRKDIPWEDECRSVLTYHNLMLEANPSWTMDQSGDALGLDKSGISDRIAVARELNAGTKIIVEATKLSTATNIIRRINERKRSAETEKLFADEPALDTPKVPLLHADFHEWAAAYTGPKFNFLHCDFPYGINADKHDQGNAGGQAASLGGYADSKEVYLSLLSTLSMGMTNVVADSAHLLFWFSMDFYQETFLALSAMGWRVSPFPLIWYKSDIQGILPDPARGPRRVYETAFQASRGDRKIIQAVANVSAWPGKDKSIHMSEKPRGMLAHFFRMFVDEYTTFLDPTAGSGNAVRAAQIAGAGTVLGIERDKEFYDRAVEAFYKEQE